MWSIDDAFVWEHFIAKDQQKQKITHTKIIKTCTRNITTYET